jgi:signal transduction histidine kinase/DNA-binding response OmpR family regulator
MIGVQGSSIVQRLTRLNLLVSGMALLIACVCFIAYDAITFRQATVRDLSIRSQVIGLNSVSALLFNDADSARKTLSALQSDPHVLSAAVYTLDGMPFAIFRRTESEPIPPFPGAIPAQMESHRIRAREIVVAHTIDSDGKPIGVVSIRSDVQALYEHLLLFAGIGALVMLASLLASLVLAAIFHKAVADPIIHLAETAKTVSQDRSYSLRVSPVPGHGEVSVLIDAFNEMMAQIEQGEARLQRAHDELELRVQERTAELVAAQQRVEAYSASVVRAMDEVEQASKFKDQFLSTMSHELRTPLNAVLGFSELLADARYGMLNERQQRYVNHIHVSGQHLLRLINDILDLSKIEAGRMQLTLEEVSVQACFLDVAGSLQSLVDKKAQQLQQEAPAGLTVCADPTRFKQVLLNLLGNAIKFTPEGGVIRLAALAQDEFVRIEVRDSGPGIPPEEQRRIFEAFHRLQQSDKAAEGTGLGLAIARRLVELHGGELGLESELGVGSCFFFTLPATVPATSAKNGGGGVEIVNNPSVKVLVIEDDATASDLLDSQLTSAGYQVTVCNEPRNALQTAADLKPDVITLDIVMLPVNGWDVLSTLKSDPRTAGIPVVVVSVMDQRQTGALLSADEYIVKPVDRAILLAAVERSLNRREERDSEESILIVEDDEATREMIAEMLSGRGYRVQLAAGGEQARTLVTASPPALVILDLILPRVSGFELIAEWRREIRTENIPILVLTSKDLTQGEKEYLHANTIALLGKHEQWADKLLQQIVKTAALEKT